MGMLVTLLVYLVIIALIWWVLNYALTHLPLPAPIPQFGRVIVMIVLVIVVVYMLLGLLGGGGISMPNLSLK